MEGLYFNGKWNEAPEGAKFALIFALPKRVEVTVKVNHFTVEAEISPAWTETKRGKVVRYRPPTMGMVRLPHLWRRETNEWTRADHHNKLEDRAAISIAQQGALLMDRPGDLEVVGWVTPSAEAPYFTLKPGVSKWVTYPLKECMVVPVYERDAFGKFSARVPRVPRGKK